MRVRSLLREPLVLFLAIGALLFLWYQWSGGGSGPASSRIVLTSGRIESLAAGFQKTWQRPPTEAELKGLVDDYVREEIATREAAAAGLDQDDTIIRRRLRQKLEFLADEAIDSAPPTDAELAAWLEAHAEDYRIEPQVALRQVYVSRDRHGASAEADARVLLARLEAQGPDAALDRFGDSLMLPAEFGLEPLREVARTFGEKFADAVLALPPGRWAGPVESGYGLHLVLVRERIDGAQPELGMVRPQVERDFMADRRRRQLDAMYERLLGKYTVVFERPDEAPKGAPR
jgi:hypothetical protein